MRLKTTSIITPALLTFIVALSFFAVDCSYDKQPAATDTTQTTGAVLARKHCTSCHKYPAPELLDQDTWTKHVLPAMAPRLGIKVYSDDQYVNNPSARPELPYEDWMKIVAFYKSAAPKKLKPAAIPTEPVKDWGGFTLMKPVVDASAPATTTMVAFDTISRRIFTSDRVRNSVYTWSGKLKVLSAKSYSSPAVDVQFSTDKTGTRYGAFTFIGSMDAIDVANGSVVDVPLNKSGIATNVIATNLPRPVQSLAGDFDKNGLNDRIVCGFGHNAGGLYLYKQMPGGRYEKNTVSSIPGAEQCAIGDFNNDGWPDVACLFAQADEGIWLLLNDHNGGFTTQNILKFPPVYGSTSFQLVDLNHDGKLDILYTCGDNGDFSRILKPYHGVYIFINQGGFKFKQQYFYPVNGATKAIAADLNGDDKPDIALIAFFSDLKDRPDEGFTYFEQTGPLKFTPHRLPISKNGRWICMDVKDIDADGKPDILLGNYALGFINQENITPTWDVHTPFVVLRNRK